MQTIFHKTSENMISLLRNRFWLPRNAPPKALHDIQKTAARETREQSTTNFINNWNYDHSSICNLKGAIPRYLLSFLKTKGLCLGIGWQGWTWIETWNSWTWAIFFLKF